MEGSATGTISCNYIHDIHGNAYSTFGIVDNSCLVKDNTINNITGIDPAGIQSRSAGSRNINNCISNSGVGIDVDGSYAISSQLIINNILYSNKIGIQVGLNGFYTTNPTIINNIITGNNYGIKVISGISTTNIIIDHNLIWNQSISNYDGVPIAGIGQIVTTNSSGYPIDSYFNMYQDPLYNGGPPTLSAASPCFGTGNTVYSANIGFTNSLGCTSTVLSVKELSKSIKLNVFPNPCSGKFTLSAGEKSEVIVTIFDMGGRTVYSTTTALGEQVVADQLENGIYILSVKDGNKSGRTLLNVLK